MAIGYDDGQLALDETARRALDAGSPVSEMRRLFEASEPHSVSAWNVLRELGVIGADVAVADGGIGLGTIETAIVADALGRVLAATPFGTQAVVLRTIADHGSAEQKSAWLASTLAGDTIGCVALAEPGNDLFDTPALRVEGGRAYGVKAPVAGGSVADFALVAGRDATGAAGLFIASFADAAVARAPMSSVDPTRGHARLTFDGAPVQRIGGADALAAAIDLQAILIAHEAVGAADHCLDIAIAFARDRQAFGRAIGSFQAIKHKLVDVYVKNRIGRTHALHAAWAFDHDPAARALAAAAAIVSASEAFGFAATEMMQVHGALGVSWEHDGHLFYRRSRVLAAELGDLLIWKDRLFRLVEANER